MIDIGIRLAVTVIAVRPGSDRGIQMLVRTLRQSIDPFTS